MKKHFTISCLVVMLLFAFQYSSYAQPGINFTFANDIITTTGEDTFFEFDIIAAATEATKFKLGQVYIDYNTAGFGPSVVANGNVTVTKGTILNPVFGPGGDIGSYVLSAADNTPSKLAVQNTWQKTDLSGGDFGYELSNTLGTTAAVYAHVKIKIADPAEYSGLSFDDGVSQFDLQQYYFTTPGSDAQANYIPTASDILDVLLPVELVSFSATSQESYVQLNWETASELNNYGFELERKLNIENSEWESIGFIEGAGNSNSKKEYSYTDKNPFGGSEFVYRLKQIDTDGQYDYSDEVEVEIVPNKYELYQNYPNPFNPVTTIRFSLVEPQKVSMKLYNVVGQEVTDIVNKDFELGYHELDFDASYLASGVYIFRIIAGDFVQVKKMMLLK